MSGASALQEAADSVDSSNSTASASGANRGVRLRFIDTADRQMPVAILEWQRRAPLLADLVALFADLGLRVANHELLPSGDDSDAHAHRFGFGTDEINWPAATPNLLRSCPRRYTPNLLPTPLPRGRLCTPNPSNDWRRWSVNSTAWKG
ncbi:hypothetical protein QM588_23785 [Rhodococcus sp. IEGM 1354]|uniref:hypothetical protein n=1 Tax=Rhodococcus sp. IEGM 1354 TaxID=3047088 RepID=UPI0024B6825D|nr:hypothetical protein [Rhodococcus sp. IEGM 1354]MDI9933448.1 hypothetical protein [Rhodococcus sp. IEGM 1354]